MAEAPSYNEVLAIIDSAESTPADVSLPIDIAAVLGRKIAVREISYEDLQALLEKTDGKIWERLSEAPQQARIQPQVPEHRVEKETYEAAGRLQNMAGAAGKEYEKSVERGTTAKEEELVLPKLSIEDQLSDLEKIEEGIIEHAFDGDQLRIITEEVDGLSNIAATENLGKFSQEQKELVAMRNQKVKEIKHELHIK